MEAPPPKPLDKDDETLSDNFLVFHRFAKIYKEYRGRGKLSFYLIFRQYFVSKCLLGVAV